MRLIIFFCFFCLSFFCVSQNSHSKELSLLSDNDLYTSLYRDGYYTNGLFLTYRTVSNSDTKNLAKKIYSYQVGHMMYTSAKATIESANLHDRPFAGYFFGEFGNLKYAFI